MSDEFLSSSSSFESEFERRIEIKIERRVAGIFADEGEIFRG